MRKLIALILSLSFAFSLTACKEESKEVAKDVEVAEDTFAAPVDLDEVNDFSIESNDSGLALFRNSQEENKMISPVSFFNTTVEIGNIVDKSEEQKLAKASNYSDLKKFINSYLQEVIISDSIWIDTETAQKYGTYYFGTEDSDIDFFLVNTETSDINLMMNNYLKDNIGIKSSPINNEKYNCQLLSTSYLKSNILLNGNITSISEENINNKNIQTITATNAILKTISYDGLTIIELPIESVNKNLVIDIFITENNLTDYSDEEIYQFLDDLSETQLSLVNNIKLSAVNDIFNENNNETFEECGLDDIFSNFKVVTESNETQDFSFDKINLVSCVDLSYSSSKQDVPFSDSIDSIEATGSFPFIIQDPANNLILFARN